MNRSNIFQYKISSQKILIAAVLGLWAIALSLSFGNFLWAIKSEVTLADIPNLLIGMSIGLLHHFPVYRKIIKRNFI
ncbi:hypothetical protein Lepto7376_3095 [[Leptolyngbya] sp. PCC 7376]|nr:hypothetical protein Lepto7376_3095 [[Leptolyngbya] sp. PCC 7376]